MRASNQLQRLSADELDVLVLAAVLHQPALPPGKTTVQILVEVKAGVNPYQILASLHRLEAQGLIYHLNDPIKPRKYWWKPNYYEVQSTHKQLDILFNSTATVFLANHTKSTHLK